MKPSKCEVHKIKLWISERCLDTDDGKRDGRGEDCLWYYHYLNAEMHLNVEMQSSCGEFDDSDFTATSLCCACGGGKPGTLTLFSNRRNIITKHWRRFSNI